MKLLAPLLVVGLCGVASADEIQHLAPTGLQVGIRFPWDVSLTPNVTGIGLAGFGMDLGERVSDRLYLGVMADYELVMNITSFTPNVESRFRAGVEARYYFHEGTAEVGGSSGECCCYSPSYTVARYDYVGLRFGGETVDELTTHGAFADFSIGTDAQIGSTQLGFYASAGISAEPASVYAAMDTTSTSMSRAVAVPDSSTATSYYFTLGMHMAFGG